MIWTLPSVIALALTIKGLLFFYSNAHKKKYFFLFLAGAFLMNLCELLLLLPFDHELTVLKLYYCAAVFTAFYLLQMCSNISQSGSWLKSNVLIIVPSIFSSVILFTDYIILNFTVLHNGAATRVAGSYYFMFQFYIITSLIFAIFFLIRKLIKKNNYHLKAQCLSALLAFLPSILLIFVIMTLMQLGYRVNMVGLLSMSLCFMLVIFISLTDKHKLFIMMSFIPHSRERAYRLKLKRILQELNNPMSGNPVQMKMLLKELESLVIEHTQDYFTTQKELAHMLNISQSSLSRKKPTIN